MTPGCQTLIEGRPCDNLAVYAMKTATATRLICDDCSRDYKVAGVFAPQIEFVAELKPARDALLNELAGAKVELNNLKALAESTAAEADADAKVLTDDIVALTERAERAERAAAGLAAARDAVEKRALLFRRSSVFLAGVMIAGWVAHANAQTAVIGALAIAWLIVTSFGSR